jgi:ATP-dependent DNA helicase RecG
MAHGTDMEIQFLPGVGPKRAELLRKELAVATVGDLLRLYPFRYIDKSSITRICDARPDMAYLQIRARVMRVDLYGAQGAIGPEYIPGTSSVQSVTSEHNPESSSGKTGTMKFNTIRRMSVWVSDGTGEMEMVFFKGIKWMFERMKPGSEFIFFGKPTTFNSRINIVHPEVDNVQTGAEGAPTGSDMTDIRSGMREGGTMTGVYPSTERLKNAGITGKVMGKIMEAALNKGLPETAETLPEYIMKQCGLVPLHFALRNIHFPKDMVSLEKAKYRLKFEELFYLQLSLLKQKYIRSRDDIGISMPKVGEAFNSCYNALPIESVKALVECMQEFEKLHVK